MLIVSIDDGDYVVFELLEPIEIAIGDRVSGDLQSMGGTTLQHLGQQCSFDVYGQTGPSGLPECQQLLESF